MKKIMLVLYLSLGSMTSMFAQAEENMIQYQEKKEYTDIGKQIQDAPDVLEFFSFYCPHCYSFETKYGITKAISDNLPKDIKLTKYHVNFMGGLSEELTEAWAVANILSVENEFGSIIFKLIHEDKNLKSIDDILTAFEKVGVSKEQYNQMKNSFMVLSLINKQKKLASDFEIQGVPSFYVKGQYAINSEGMNDKQPIDKQFSDVINYLLKESK